MFKARGRACVHLVAFVCANAASALGAGVRVPTSWRHQLPHLDSLVQTAGNKVLAIGSEAHAVHTVLVSILALQSLDEITRGGVPNTHTLVQRTSRDVFGIGRDSHSRHTVFDGQSENVSTCFNVPQSNRPIART